MNRYELLKQNDKIIYQLVRNGIMSYQVIRDIEIYERFNELEDLYNNQMKYILLSDEFELGIKRIEQIVYVMSKVVI